MWKVSQNFRSSTAATKDTIFIKMHLLQKCFLSSEQSTLNAKLAGFLAQSDRNNGTVYCLLRFYCPVLSLCANSLATTLQDCSCKC